LHPLFRIYKVQDDEALQFLQAMHTLHDAKERVLELGKLWPGEYMIEIEETGERLMVTPQDGTKN
jgi:hypothetical protein